MRNEEEYVCSVRLFRCNIFIGVRITKEILGLVVSGTLCIKKKLCTKLVLFTRLYVGCSDMTVTLPRAYVYMYTCIHMYTY